MSFIFKFPDIGEGIAEGTILEWYVEVGQTVKAGENIVKMETDKVVADIPSPRDGVIVARHGSPQQTINVGDPLVEIDMGADAPQQGESAETETADHQESVGVVGTLEIAKDSDCLPASDEGQSQTSSGTTTTSKSKKVLATPAVRAMARKLHVAIHEVTGTGINGRILKKDIQAYLDAGKKVVAPVSTAPPTADAKVEYEPLTQIRKTIAKRMVLSKQTAPHMTVFEEVEVSSLVALRDQHKDRFAEQGVMLTYLPFIIKAVVRGLKKYKALNSQLDMENERIIYKYDYNISIAVDAPDGLVVPVIHQADKLSIFDLSQKIADLAQRGRARQLNLAEMQSGTFTITNFGAIAGTHAVPVINYPEVGILGVGRIRQLPVVADNAIKVGNVLPLSLTVDHRVVDGGDTTRFLKSVVESLADPVSLLMY